MHRKAVPERMAPNLERRLSPHLLNQPVDIGTDRLACDRKDPLVLPKLSHLQVALDPGLEVPVEDRDEAFGRALQAAFARPPCPLLERLEDDPEVAAVATVTNEIQSSTGKPSTRPKYEWAPVPLSTQGGR